MNASSHRDAPLILVVGMHRSGTSLLGSILQRLGIAMPGELISGDQHNPTGYYERSDITALQEELLIALGHWWPSASGVFALPSDWLDLPVSQKASRQLHQWLKKDLNHQNHAWAIKDPRTSLLLPLWQQVAADLNIPLRIVLSVRDPAEVMVSLLQRDSTTAGMTAWRSQQLWWHHNRQLLIDAAKADLPVLTINYSDWFVAHKAHRQLETLTRFCAEEHPSAQAVSLAAACIKTEHRRSRSHRRHLPMAIHPDVASFYRRLTRLSPKQPSKHQKLLSWLTKPGKSLPQQHQPGAWFDVDHYRKQVPGLPQWINPFHHYCLIGWRRQRSPHPLFEANHYRHTCHQQGIAVKGAPLIHFLKVGLEQGLPPSSLADSKWSLSHPHRRQLLQAARLEGLHPWGCAALALHEYKLSGAMPQLRHWQKHGLTSGELTRIWTMPASLLSTAKALLTPTTAIQSLAELHVIGCNPNSWQTHAWLAHLPLPTPFKLANNLHNHLAAPPLGLVLGSIPTGSMSINLQALAQLSCVWNNLPTNEDLLWRLGVNSQLINTEKLGQHWLQQDDDARQVNLQLGLPSAKSLAKPGTILCLGNGGAAWQQAPNPLIWWLPGFDQLTIESEEQARILAAWLNDCQQQGLQLVRIDPSPKERVVEGWRAIGNTQLFQSPLSPGELLEELTWRKQGAPKPCQLTTYAPSFSSLYGQESTCEAKAAVCVSLYNYEKTIIRALESVLQQSLKEIELIVVDDHSSDQGPNKVKQWLEQHANRFVRTQLVRHHQNAGLAAARNSAFNLARANWCFVLDADNSLQASAVEACLNVATAASAEIAVVHPLVMRRENNDDGTTHTELLAGGLSWQKSMFLERNIVDAMALVRRVAWNKVGGYTHIPGGWEDYDFWCKLIEAGYGGVICPQQLAVYYSHSNSMLSKHTHQQLRAISRQLQERHPWLQLALARGLNEATDHTP
ncbi:glycosyltransferase [Prochlorococcus sp. MIT 1201]|uniref:glycosyltransferase n=1 Tax=Prochlorococcus sp. MIT 1201 TaxID=3082535 RepID=UPI0039A57ACF